MRSIARRAFEEKFTAQVSYQQLLKVYAAALGRSVELQTVERTRES